MEKEIKSKDNKFFIQIHDSGYVPFISIKKVYINDKKIVTFSMWDDFQFNAYSNDNESELLFEFKNDDYLYPNLNTLLGEDREITIDDDNTLNEFEKFMSIIRKDDSIVIMFHGNANSKLVYQKYSVFIKNILPDARSKIKNSDLKIRLIEFFENCKKSLLQEEKCNHKAKIKNKCICRVNKMGGKIKPIEINGNRIMKNKE